MGSRSRGEAQDRPYYTSAVTSQDIGAGIQQRVSNHQPQSHVTSNDYFLSRRTLDGIKNSRENSLSYERQKAYNQRNNYTLIQDQDCLGFDNSQ